MLGKSCLGMAFASLLMFSGTAPLYAQNFENRMGRDWGGARSWLYHHGLDFEIVYATSVWNNFSGGVKTGGTQFDNLDLALTIDG